MYNNRNSFCFAALKLTSVRCWTNTFSRTMNSSPCRINTKESVTPPRILRKWKHFGRILNQDQLHQFTQKKFHFCFLWSSFLSTIMQLSHQWIRSKESYTTQKLSSTPHLNKIWYTCTAVASTATILQRFQEGATLVV